ncbi:MAG: fibro-slime domain-containing protein [Reichenbachiella sp.]
MIIKCLSIVLLFLLVHCTAPTTEATIESSTIGTLDSSEQPSSVDGLPTQHSSDQSSDSQKTDKTSNNSSSNTSSEGQTAESSNDSTPNTESTDASSTEQIPEDEVSYEACTDGIDNDHNGLIDCAEAKCQLFLICTLQENDRVTCTDGVDNNADGEADCDDSVCEKYDYCHENTIHQCYDALDNDNDGAVDCDDDECKIFELCSESTLAFCNDGLDNDNDGTADCADPDCFIYSQCGELSAGLCDNGVDDDHDGSIDCADSDCLNFEQCATADGGDSGLNACTDGLDNDGDDEIDCSDDDCHIYSVCGELTPDLCMNGVDDDQDGMPDCADSDCVNFEVCAWIHGDGDGQGAGCGSCGGGDGGGDVARCNDDWVMLKDFERVELTVYDHTDTWEDFGNPNADGVKTGMVMERLGNNGLPMFKENLASNANIEKWWTEEEFPVYTTRIVFDNTGGGLYQLKDTEFFPLDDIPTTKEDNPNYYFAAHFQQQFIYDGDGGQKFEFNGINDVFVFLNGNLVLDLGGADHNASGSFILDVEADRLGISEGSDMTLDFFIANRKMVESQAIIGMYSPCMFN